MPVEKNLFPTRAGVTILIAIFGNLRKKLIFIMKNAYLPCLLKWFHVVC